MARDEEWLFERYRSLNEFWIGGKRVARDVMLLEDEKSPKAPEVIDDVSSPETLPSHRADTSSLSGIGVSNPDLRSHSVLPTRSIRDRLAPYACYATLFLVGPLAGPIISLLASRYDSISQMQLAEPEALVWSMCPLSLPKHATGLGEGQDIPGAIIRIMGTETERVRAWLKDALQPLATSVGQDALRAAFVS